MYDKEFDSIDGKVPMNPISIIGLKTLGFSVLGMLGAFFIRTRKLFGSLMLLAAAIGGYMIISTLYIVPCIFFLLSCCRAIYQSRAETKESSGDTCQKTKDVV
ncbi:hypothetical protein D1970_10140 [Mesobacillus zeae]|uniref:Uncharacterized protein n=1 Tax=Mesobacillus zeae TaxID=1917180 RepID=A0A398BE71_9BACI|nr:hypothetical protein D1970_10140 [Mesobacillus zeae]